MRAVVVHEPAVGELRTWELVEADMYYLDNVWGMCVHGQWASGPIRRHQAFPAKFVQVLA